MNLLHTFKLHHGIVRMERSLTQWIAELFVLMNHYFAVIKANYSAFFSFIASVIIDGLCVMHKQRLGSFISIALFFLSWLCQPLSVPFCVKTRKLLYEPKMQPFFSTFITYFGLMFNISALNRKVVPNSSHTTSKSYERNNTQRKDYWLHALIVSILLLRSYTNNLINWFMHRSMINNSKGKLFTHSSTTHCGIFDLARHQTDVECVSFWPKTLSKRFVIAHIMNSNQLQHGN